jgi:hypothetical protein
MVFSLMPRSNADREPWDASAMLVFWH